MSSRASVPSPVALIALDWGTTHLRAHLVGEGGEAIDTRVSRAGVMAITGEGEAREAGFREALHRIAADWLTSHPGIPVVAAGMIGSSLGWREVPYVSCPAGVSELARGLAPVPIGEKRKMHVVPGLRVGPAAPERGSGAEADPLPDVLRGEEVQVLGLLAGEPGAREGWVVLPGTHSKWTSTGATEGGAPAITGFATWMTGELYALLLEHGILGRPLPERERTLALRAGPGERQWGPWFDRGVERARAESGGRPGDLLHHLFGARTLHLDGALPARAIPAWLSGLLVGAEIVAAAGGGEARATLHVVGAPGLARLYERAGERLGHSVQLHDPSVGVRGVWEVARAAGLAGAPAPPASS